MSKKTLDREQMLAAMRKKMEERKQTRRDPDQFIPPKMKEKEVAEYYFRVLPELQEGDTCKGGVCKKSSDLWYYENGNHYIDNQRYECPRVHDREECPVCQMGFDLMADSDDQEYRKKVSKNYLPRTSYAINIYFLNIKKNPEAVRGKVMWYNAQKTVWDKMDQCINSDDQGDPEEPRACGLFYHPYENGYTFKLILKNKGDWNSYEESAFVASSIGPLVKLENGSPDDATIQKILDQRVYVQDRFKSRDADQLQQAMAKIMNREQGRDNTEVIGGGVVKGGAAKISPPKPSMPSMPSAPSVPSHKPAPKHQELAEQTENVDDDGADEMPDEAEVTEASKTTDELEETPRTAQQKPALVPTKAAPKLAAKPQQKPAAAAEAEDDAELANLLSAIHKGKS